MLNFGGDSEFEVRQQKFSQTQIRLNEMLPQLVIPKTPKNWLDK